MNRARAIAAGMSSTASASRLHHVVVMANGALVTRRASVAAGSTRLVLDRLPLRLVDDTLRVRPLTKGVQVGLVQERCQVTVTRSSVDTDQAAILEARLVLLRIGQQRASLKTLRTVGAVDVELPPPEIAAGPDAAGLLALLAAADRRGVALQQLEQQLAQEQRRAEKHLRDLEQRRRGDAVPPRVLRGIEAVIEAPADGEVEVEYFVTAARWVPAYGLHLRTEADGRRRGRVVLGALVAQASGEDWNDVALSVSTSRLDRASTLPIVHSWRLGRAQPAVVKGFRPLPSDLPQLFSGWDRFGLEPMMPSEPLPAPAPPPPPPSPARLSAPMKAMPPRPMSAPSVLGEVSRRAAALDDDDDSAEGEPRGDDDGAGYAAEAEESAAPERMKRRSEPMRDMMPSGATASFGGGGRGGPGGRTVAEVVDELPPRLRTASLRMAFANEGAERGLLMPMSTRERLAWLLDVADVSADEGDARRAEVHRALDALEAAEYALSVRPLPPGTHGVNGALACVFAGAGTTSIASDGHEHRVEVHGEDLAVDVVHQAVPRESLDVWRVAMLTPRAALPPGPVQVYDDGQFVVSGAVGGLVGLKMNFNLGIDPDVRIVSRTPHLQQAEKGLMGGTSHVEHRVVTVVRNSGAEPVRLTIFDRIPVVDDNVKDVTVTLTSSQPPLSRTDRGPDERKVDGGVSAVVTVMPDDTIRLEHTWIMTLPAKMEIVGGNRRE